MTLENLFENPLFLIVFLLWSIGWKGYALWIAGRREQLSWFIILLIVNTMGIFEILYIIYFQKYDLGSKKVLAAMKKLPFSKKINKLAELNDQRQKSKS